MLDLDVWHLWTIAGVILFILEIFVPGFVVACLGVGCLVTAIPAALDLSLEIQVLVFAAGSLAAFFAARPIMIRSMRAGANDLKSNTDALAGKPGRVVEAIDPDTDAGRVKVGGEDWRAAAEDGQAIEKGTNIQVVRVEGATVIVARSGA
jgi:membrane protein implicated in regulation of membrane protease activity